MNLLTLGLNHTTASVEVREKASLVPDKISELLEFVKVSGLADEIVVLSTCNRTEFYFKALHISIQEFVEVWAHYSKLNSEDVLHYIYQLDFEETILHLFKVAAGLDSLILGEPQILGQLKQSLVTATHKGTAKKYLNRLFQLSFNVAKTIRTETNIGAYAVSVAFTAVQLARQIFDGLENHNVLLVGAGETTELVARHLIESGVKSITVANRSNERAEILMHELNIKGQPYLLEDLSELLINADIVVSSTMANQPLITKEMVKGALKARRNKPILLIDLAVPRDIEASIAKLDGIYLYTVDDLTMIVEDNQRSREMAALKAEHYLQEGLVKWNEWYKLAEVGNLINKINVYAEEMVQKSRRRARSQITNGKSIDSVLNQLTNQLTNRLLHPLIEHIKNSERDNNESELAKILKEFE